MLGDTAHIGAGSAGRGRLGEQVAQVYLAGKGFRVLACNQRTPLGELDLICGFQGRLVIVEVKARATRRFGGGLEAIGPGKIRRLRGAAAWWLAAQGWSSWRLRFDAVVVSLDEDGSPLALRHYPDLYGDGAD